MTAEEFVRQELPSKMGACVSDFMTLRCSGADLGEEANSGGPKFSAGSARDQSLIADISACIAQFRARLPVLGPGRMHLHVKGILCIAIPQTRLVCVSEGLRAKESYYLNFISPGREQGEFAVGE